MNSKIEQIENFVLLTYAIFLPISLTVSEVLLIVGTILSLLQLVLTRLSGPQAGSTKFSLPPLTVPLALLTLAITVSGAYNGYETPGLFGTQSLAEAGRSLYDLLWTLLPYFWAFSVFHRNKALAISAIILLLWTSSLAGIWGSIQQIFDIHPGKFKYLQGTGFHSNPMAFGGQMQIFSMIALGLLLGNGYRELDKNCLHSFMKPVLTYSQNTFVFLFIVAANLAGLYFAVERNTWLGGVAGVLALSLLKSWRIFAIAIASLAAAASASWFFVDVVRHRIEILFSGTDVSVTARQKIWSECLNQYYPRSPVFGIGWMKFPHFDIPEAIVPGVSKELIHAHSNYIQFLTTTGICGLASFIMLTIWTIVLSVKRYNYAMKEADCVASSLRLGCLGVAVSIAVSGIFEFNFGSAQVRLAQWFVLALL